MRQMKKYNNINELLESAGGRLMSLRSRSRERCEVLSHVRAALPAEFEGRVMSAGIEEGRLTVGVAAGAWATRLRYRTEALRKHVAGTLGKSIHSVRIKVVQSNIV